ncbi:hypothetical protein ASG77_11275 [Arthrobacter sp. Soil762]|nr:hypothetical protein ASG77_11275 [Arthrobacter sp. Soil762]
MLLTGSFETGLEAVFRERLWLAGVVLTLPVSAAYFAVGFLLDSSGPPSPGVTRYVRHLRWTVPLAVLLSLPQWFVAGFAWCGISGCSGGGFGVYNGAERLAVTMTVVNGFILAGAAFAVPRLYPTGKRALIALAAGTLFGLLGAAVTHG